MKELSVEKKDSNCLVKNFFQFVAFEVIQNALQSAQRFIGPRIKEVTWKEMYI
jgi:hypothetical protein